MAPVFDEDVTQLVRAHVRSVMQLEVLLHMHREAERWLSATEVNGALRSSLAATAKHLEELCSSGLLECRTGADPTYHFAPSRPGDAEVIAKLADLFRDRFHSVVDLIYVSRRSSARAFADAFKIKKGDKDDG